MKVNLAGVIVSNVGSILLGLLPASIIAWAMGRLWSVMELPVFFAVLLSWIITVVARMVRNRGSRDIVPISLSASMKEVGFSWENLKNGGEVARLNFIQNSVVILLSCFIFASLTAGLVGLLLPTLQWRVFIVAGPFWFAVAVGAIFSGRARAERRSQV